MTLWGIFVIEERREPTNTPGTVPPHHSPSRAELRGMAPEGRGWGGGKLLTLVLEKTVWMQVCEVQRVQSSRLSYP